MSDKIEFPWQELFRLRSDAVDHAETVRELKEAINAMKCCANCRHAHYDGMDYECYADIHGITGDCCPPDLELWELRAKGDKKP